MASTYPVVIEALDANKPTLTAGETGVLCSTQDTKKLYYWTGTGWTQIALATSGYKASFDNPPASPSAYDDEFDSTALDAKWTIGSSGTTNPATTGTIDYTASLTTPIIDLATVPSWLMMQSDNSSAKAFWIRQSHSPSTNATFFMKVGCFNGNVSTSGEGQIVFRLTNSADSNEAIYCGVAHTGSAYVIVLGVINNGAVTSVLSWYVSENTPVPPTYIVCWKKSDVYHCGYAWGTGAFSYLGAVTKTGVTTFDQQQIEMTTANETPSIIEGVDFYRYYPSITYALMN